MTFRALRAFNDPSLTPVAAARSRLDERLVTALEGATSPALLRLVKALAARRALVIKELVESLEFFERVRHRVRARHVADLCAGHGLTGLLFAAYERDVERVTLLDLACHDNQATVLAAVLDVAPWAADKVERVQARVQDAARFLEQGSAVVAVHACGARTDRALDAALEVGGALAVMPCCHASSTNQAPRALQEALGPHLSCDIERTYRLERAGYRVSWQSVPDSITPMNRILVGVPDRG